MMCFSVKKCTCLLLCAAMAFASSGCSGFLPNADSGADLYINEVVTSNSFSLVDEALGSPDWIELYNATSKPIDLEGYGLSDNIKDPHKWVFPSVTVPANGFIVVYAAKYEGEGALCTGFGLSKSGETIYLTDPYYDLMQQLEIPALAADVSFARTSDGSFGYCSAPTPNAQNIDADIFLSATENSSAAPNGSDLALTEVMPKNSSTLAASDGGYYAWAEVYNTSSAAILLSDYFLSDSAAEPSKWRFPALTLEAGQYAIVFLSGEDSAENGEIHASFKLGKSDFALVLSNGAGTVLSMLNWTSPIPAGISVVAPDTYSPIPTPGGENSTKTFASLDFSQMTAADPVRINEVLKLNEYSLRDSFGDRSPWVELYNSSASAVPLLGCFLSDDPDDPFKWAFPDVSIDAGAYLVVFLSGKNVTEGELHTPFKLSRSENEVVFTDSNTLHRDLVELDPNIGKNVSAGLGEDGLLHFFASPTPGAKNSTHAFDTAAETALVDMSGVYISEVCAVTAAKSGAPDWIELHNASDSSVNLEGWHLTDDANDMYKFTFPSFKISSGGYVTISASTSSKSGVSAPFNISASGDTLILTDEDGNVRDVFNSGSLRLGVTSGRVKGDERRVFFSSATKGEANTASVYASFTAEPVFSDTSLYHSDAFSVSISCPTQGAKIYYTTDGSKPTSSSSLYTGPLAVSANTPLKAVAIADGLLQSDIAAATYLFETPHTLPVICLTTDAASFEQVYSVIDRWKKVEREGYFEFYETDGLLGVEFPCGLRVNGASTLLMRQKSLSIFLRGAYGQSSTSYKFFPNSDASEYHSLCVRNSGQDAAKARLRDSFFMKAVEGLNIDNIETRLAVVYINGQYWGLYDLNENQNEDYLATHYGVDADAVNIIRRNETPLAGDRTDFYRVRAYALEGDIANASKYEELCKWVDADYFIDYLIAQTYFSNGDMFNQKYWRTTDYAVKWRPVYYDLDLAMGSSSPTRNVLPSYFNAEGVPSQDGSLTNMDIFVGLRKNSSWCEKFGARYVYVVNTLFDAKRLTGILDDMQSEMEPEMQRHIKRWGSPSSVSAWKDNVASLRSCLEKRADYALKALQREFGFSNAQMQEWAKQAESGNVE